MNDEITMPKVAQEGEACPNCAAPMAPDQRYCLNCGARRGEPRVPIDRYLGSSNGDAALADALTKASQRSNEVSPLGVILGIALLGGMLLLGVLLGRDSNDDTTTTAATTPTEAAVPSAAPATGGDVVSEWPAGTDGFTIELGTLPKDGTTAADVETTKSDLESRGATDVGVLDSDLYPSLPPSNYVLYSGVYTKKAEAESALAALTASVPEALVVKVSTSSGGGAKADSSAATPDAGEVPPVTEPEAPATELPSTPGAVPEAEVTTPSAEELEQRAQEAAEKAAAGEDGR